jgi:hypothetical protein
MTLHDQHLQQALRNAPDRELMPSDATREAVLTYANKVLKPHHKAWQSRLTDLLHGLHGSNWQLASMGSVLATLLVVVVFWYERPDDTSWVTEPTEVTIADNSKGVADAVSSRSFPDNKIAEAVIEEKPLVQKSLGKLSQDKEFAKDVQVDKPQAALPAAPAESTVVASADTVARNEGLLSRKSEVPSVATVETAETDNLAESDVDLNAGGQEHAVKKSMAAAEVHTEVKSKTASAKVGATMPAKTNAYDENATLIGGIEREGGKAIASKDIQAGNLRLLKIEEQFVKGSDPVKCPQPATQSLNVDVLTGYKVVMINICTASKALPGEVDNYNQTMRDWHAKDRQAK